MRAWRGMGTLGWRPHSLRRSAWASRATAAGVGGFPLLTVLVYVADEYPAIYASAGASRQACPQQRGARMSHDGASGLQTSLFSSKLTPPGRSEGSIRY